MFFMPGGLPPEMFGGMFGGKGKGKGEDDEGAPPKEVENSHLYELLGVEKGASASDIKKAYHKMAMRHHPDKGGDPEIFKDIQRAFEVLSDPERRQTYDQYGEEGLQEDSPGHAQDLLSQLFGGGKGGGGKGRRQRPRTKDQARLLWVTLEQLYSGVTRPLPIARKVVDESSPSARCEACGGQGMIIQVVRMGPIIQQMQQECPSCHGVGSSARMTTEREVLEVFVEKGAPDGHKIVFHGKSDEAPDHEPGDVVVIVKQQDHDRFMRKGADLYMERDISVTEALTGFKIVVPHLDGRKLVVRSAPGEVLQPQRGGMVLKAVRGGGMPIHQDPFSFGNLFIVLSIRFPLSMDPATAAEIRRLLGERPVDEEEQAAEGEEVEEALAEDIDPLESAKQSAAKAGAQAYDEDADSMGPGVQCKQQ